MASAALIASPLAAGTASHASDEAQAHGPGEARSGSQRESNKKLVTDLFELIYHGKPADMPTLDRLVAADYIQHNPRAEPGREGLRKFLVFLMTQTERELRPEDTISVTLIAEGDMVVRQEMRVNGMLIDIFRVQNGKLQEHWDAFRFAPGAKRIPGF